jgi:NADH-quinone oxidoreductase subunit A
MLIETTTLLADGGVELVQGMTIFVVPGIAMAAGALIAGRFLRPSLPNPEKSVAYECGEPAIGSSWVQFDLRFYVVALVFLVFDVEIALFYPWAVVYGSGDHGVKVAALYDMLFFFGVLVVGFLYLWRFGYLDWVRASTGGRSGESVAPPPRPREYASA